jgi:hypothetical protein
VWVLCLEHNKRVFNTSSHSCSTSIYFCIFHLFKHWTSSSINLEHILVVDVAPAQGHPVPVLPSPTSSIPQVVDASTRTGEDDDLLDY